MNISSNLVICPFWKDFNMFSLKLKRAHEIGIRIFRDKSECWFDSIWNSVFNFSPEYRSTFEIWSKRFISGIMQWPQPRVIVISMHSAGFFTWSYDRGWNIYVGWMCHMNRAESSISGHNKRWWKGGEAVSSDIRLFWYHTTG